MGAGGTNAEPYPLQIVALLSDRATAELMERALIGSDDVLHVADSLSDGLRLATSAAPDVVFVDISLGENAGLAVVHHVRAIAPGVAIYALARPDALELGSQAVALGGAGVLMLPLSGDEFLGAVGQVRARKAELEERAELEREAAMSRRGASLITSLAGMAEAQTRREAAERLASALITVAGATRVLVYLPAGEGSRQLMRAAVVGPADDGPTYCDDMTVLGFAGRQGLEVVRLSLQREHFGLVLLGGLRPRPGEGALPLADAVAAQAATVLALVSERELSTRSAMKDSSSSAYTFAYFVDVAGRELDKARRYGRRLALATLAVTLEPARARVQDLSREAAERVLSVVRDTDVLAKVDGGEFHLLMPETGGMGAHSCRRRVLRQLIGPGGLRRGDGPPLDVAMGVATFPHDGADLSQLLRVAKYRSEASRRSLARRLLLDRVGLAELIDRFLNDAEAQAAPAGVEAPRLLELPAMDAVGLAVATVSEATRGGATQVVATQRSGVSIGAAVRSALGSWRDDVRFTTVDVTDLPGCADVEALIVIAEHGAYSLVGRNRAGSVRARHLADPLFADLMLQRLGDAAGVRLFD